MNDRQDRRNDSERPRRSNDNRSGGYGGNNRRNDGERRPFRGDRDDRGGYRGGERRNDGDRPAYRGGDRDDRGGYRGGERRNDGERRPFRSNDGERRPFRGDRDDRGGYRGGERRNDGERKPFRGGERRNDGERRPFRGNDGERKPFRNDRDDRGGYRGGDRRNDGERRSFGGDREDRGGYRGGERRNDGERRPFRSNDGERKPFRNDRDDRGGYRGGDRRYDGERKPFRSNDGERRPFRGDRDDRGGYRGGDRRNDGERRPFRGDRDDRGGRDSYGRGGTRGGGRSDRGGAQREFTEEERLQHSLRPVRREHDDPIIADHITEKDLHPSARNELKTLQPDVQERVARHLAMVALLIDEDPELAHQHAISASRRAGRIPVTRETLAITAYQTGDYALAIREIRTFRRLSGRDSNIAILVDSERGLGRPDKAIEAGLEIDASKLEPADRVNLAIAMSGARLDLGQTQQALFELEIAELDPKKAFSWSPDLFAAYATVLEDLGREAESKEWYDRANRAAAALEEHFGGLDELEVIEIHEHDYLVENEEHGYEEPAAADEVEEADEVDVADAADDAAEVQVDSTDEADETAKSEDKE